MRMECVLSILVRYLHLHFRIPRARPSLLFMEAWVPQSELVPQFGQTTQFLPEMSASTLRSQSWIVVKMGTLKADATLTATNFVGAAQLGWVSAVNIHPLMPCPGGTVR